MMQLRIGLVTVCCCIAIAAFAQQSITIQFRNKVGNNALQLGTAYKNPFGEEMVINRFKYYVSNIKLIGENNNAEAIFKNYYLIDEADSASKTITLSSSLTQIKAIEFLLGVDSVRNVSGVQTGALDPMNGMFWTWNSGYVMAKLEGVSPSAKVPGNLFSHHVGGYKSGENAARKIRLTVYGLRSTVIIEADIAKWFQSVHSITINEHPICHSPGNLAMQLADNYATMFKIVPVN